MTAPSQQQEVGSWAERGGGQSQLSIQTTCADQAVFDVFILQLIWQKVINTKYCITKFQFKSQASNDFSQGAQTNSL